MNNINVKSISVPKIPRPFMDGVWLAIAAFIRQFTTDENDKAIRELMGELTPAEARAEIMGDIENAERNRLAADAWSV